MAFTEALTSAGLVKSSLSFSMFQANVVTSNPTSVSNSVKVINPSTSLSGGLGGGLGLG